MSQLNDVQVGLLRMFDRPMSQEESLEVRRLLTRFYAEKARDAATKIAQERGYTAADYDSVLNRQQRS
ncbi:MAG: hypothetical protein EAZ91_02045 [Cytophagales bacterium]|nr:MAG: hypothetical protein EAZ91_02045 [Cytophagales bacterium]